MKKFLSLILTLVLVLNIFVGTGIFAFAEGGSAEVGDTECTHTDGADNYNNICDLCKEYIGTDELVLGENTVMMTDYYGKLDLIKFVPAESGDYCFYSTMTENDPRAYLFDSELNRLVYDDDGNGYPNFGFVWQLEAGKTYYLSVVTLKELGECSMVIEKHVHSGGKETCMGLLCNCGNYYGETTYEHRLDTTQTCIGYQCYDCGEFFGEGTGIHNDSSDEHINVCDHCGDYIGEDSVDLGVNKISAIRLSYVYVSFIPSETGGYIIYSESEYDPKIVVYSSDFEKLKEADDQNGANFSLAMEFEAEKTYYLAIYEYNSDNELTFFIAEHEHDWSDGVCRICYEECQHNVASDVQTCLGYLCGVCNVYYGEANNEHRLDTTQTCLGYQCLDCWDYFGEASDEHQLDTTQTCLGYECLDCWEYFGEKSSVHLDVGDEQTCSGYYCYDCNQYVGEGTGLHTDGEDEYNNLCDFCEKYIGTMNAKLGENTIYLRADEYYYIAFTPSVSGFYAFYSTEDTEFDPDIYIFDADWEELMIDSSEGEFNVIVELTAGETYYLRFKEYEDDNNLTYYIEAHISHTDGEDEYADLCDDCYCFIGEDLVLGSSDVGCCDIEDNEHYKTYRFVPTESGRYVMVSINGEDPYVVFFHIGYSGTEYINSADDNFSFTNRDFSLTMNLVAGEVYYFGFSSYDDEGEFEILFVKHDECTDTVTMCYSNYCTVCGKYISESDVEGEHMWSYGKCYLCNETIPENYAHEHEYSYGQCRTCGVEIPEDYAHEHIWDDGDCIICNGNHDCKVSDWDEDGYCKVCKEDAGFKIIRDGEVTYYKGLTAVIEAMQDGDLVVMLEDRYINIDYTIDADVTFDLNGCGLSYGSDENVTLNVYGDVTFVNNSPDDVGYIDVYINVYGDVTFVRGIYYYIELCNGQSLADVIPECSDVYQYDESGYELVDISGYELNYAFYFVIMSNDDKHVAKQVVSDATCTSDMVIDDYCIYCEKHLDATVVENTIKPHNYKPVYGEGYKKCADCDQTLKNVIYSGNVARVMVSDFGAEVVPVVKNALEPEKIYEATTEILTVAGEMIWDFLVYAWNEITN